MASFDWFRPVTRYIVLRAAPGLPWNYLPERMNGRWIDRPDVSLLPVNVAGGGYAIATATGRYERRDDGVLAEVYEIGPTDAG